MTETSMGKAAVSVERSRVQNQMALATGLWLLGSMAMAWCWVTPDTVWGSGIPVLISVLAAASSAMLLICGAAGWAYLYRFVVGGAVFYEANDRLVFLHPLFFSVRPSDVVACRLHTASLYESYILIRARGRNPRKLKTYLLRDPVAAFAYLDELTALR